LSIINSRFTFQRTNFRNKDFVYIPLSDQGAIDCWIPLERYLWQNPTCLQLFHRLKNIYISNRRLFCDLLDIKNAQIEDLVSEATLFRRDDFLSHIVEVFLVMEKFLKTLPGALSIHSATARPIQSVIATMMPDIFNSREAITMSGL
jgi:hypothetical protein